MRFAGLANPIADGIVASLSKPAGNFTGFTNFNAAIAGKWLQLLKEISPSIDRVVVMYNPAQLRAQYFFVDACRGTANWGHSHSGAGQRQNRDRRRTGPPREYSWRRACNHARRLHVDPSQHDLRVYEQEPPADDVSASLICRGGGPGILRIEFRQSVRAGRHSH
jgi:ABC transporter substrate binding protein